MTNDPKTNYLGTPLDRYEYMHIPVKYISNTIMKQYNLSSIAHKVHVIVEIQKGMYGLTQAVIIYNKRLIDNLATPGYHKAKHTPGLFTH